MRERERERERNLSVRDYVKQLRAAGDATEEDFVDAEIADAAQQGPRDDGQDKKDDKDDASKKASI